MRKRDQPSLQARSSKAFKEMIYIKGLFVGSFTLLLSIVVYVVIWTWFMSGRYAELRSSGGEIGFDLSSLIYSPLFWLVAVAGFALGFVWMLRLGHEKR